jgi:hypothetical protein
MNVNERVLNQHVEYEPQAYMYAFTIELEISAAAMWCFVNHLKSNVIMFSGQVLVFIDSNRCLTFVFRLSLND